MSFRPPRQQNDSMAFDMCRKKERTTDLVIQAVKAGFRGIDTACQPKACHPPSLG